MKKENKNIVIENAEILFRNFEGKKGKFNAQGARNFCVILNPDIVEDLVKDGWNVKYLKPFYDDDDVRAYLQVSVSYNNYPPNIYLVSSSGKTRLDENDINLLDWAELKNVDLIIRPYNWEVDGKTGIKAYVKSMYVTIEEDAFSSKYSDIPEVSKDGIIEVDDDIPF